MFACVCTVNDIPKKQSCKYNTPTHAKKNTEKNKANTTRSRDK